MSMQLSGVTLVSCLVALVRLLALVCVSLRLRVTICSHSVSFLSLRSDCLARLSTGLSFGVHSLTASVAHFLTDALQFAVLWFTFYAIGYAVGYYGNR